MSEENHNASYRGEEALKCGFAVFVRKSNYISRSNTPITHFSVHFGKNTPFAWLWRSPQKHPLGVKLCLSICAIFFLKFHPWVCDILCIPMCTFVGYKSMRDPTHGSVFIKCLVSTFYDFACTEHVRDLLDIVSLYNHL